MACAERSALWGYAAGELAPEARAQLDVHLSDCASCKHELEAMVATREVLSLASPQAPQVDWRRADDQVHGAVERRFARMERSWMSWFLPGLVGAGAVAMVIAFMAIGRHGQSADLTALTELEPIPMPSAVESAEGALVFSRDGEHLIKAGEDLTAGTSVRTTTSGKAVFKLPEGSRVRVASATDVVLQRSARDEVGLVLNKGRVAIKATHAARKEFVVEAAGVRVRVVGTAFSVNLSEKDVDVAVVEGRVLVEFADGTAKLVSAGERTLVDRVSGEQRSGVLTQADKWEMGELGVELAMADPKRPRPIAQPRQPIAMVTPAPVPMAAPSPNPEPAAKIVEAQSDEWKSMPTPMAQVEAPVSRLHPKRPQPGLDPITPFAWYLDKAEAGDQRGQCARFLPNLENDLEDNPEEANRERALIIAARCNRALGNMAKADKWYRVCRDEFPKGRYAAEARSFGPH